MPVHVGLCAQKMSVDEREKSLSKNIVVDIDFLWEDTRPVPEP